MNQTVYMQKGNIFSQMESDFNVFPTIEKGIYTMQRTSKGELFLEKVANKFEFNFKLYGVDDTLVRHVLDTYHKSEVKSNIGVLLNGSKGTGKTVTAKLMANQLGLPVITLTSNFPGLDNFIAKMNQDCIFFLDEFEKNFQQRDEEGNPAAGQDLLSIMDGVYNCTGHSHIFILTTNELKINDNLISRPSRIRYIKSFGSVIDRKILEEYVDDNLKYAERRDELMEFVDTLDMATIDIVKSLVDEINIHNCSIEEIKPIFNVRQTHYTYFCRGWNLQDDDLEGFDYSECHPADYKFKHPYTIKEFVTDCNELERSAQRHRPWYHKSELIQPISKLKEGDILAGMEVVHAMDENNVIILKRGRYSGETTWVYVENPEAKPSLWSSQKTSYDYHSADRFD